MALLTAHEVAKRCGFKAASLYSKPFRARIGLRAIKLGASLRFDSRDVEELIQRSKERLLSENGQEA